jgi:hypothetical protein
MYDLDFLIETFTVHIAEAEKAREESIITYKESMPGLPIPKSITDDFNFPRALKTICIEIKKIKENQGKP